MVKKWLHVTEPPGNPWVLPIWTAVNDAVKRGTCSEPNDYTRNLGLYISTRLNMLPLIISRINKNWKLIYDEIKTYDDRYIYQEDKEGYAIPIDGEILNTLLIDIDSFLFEANSCCELIINFFGEVNKTLGEKIKEKDLGRRIREILIENGQDATWFSLLDKDRNFFIHQGTPYIAIDISTIPPDLLIMKENLKSFIDSNKFTRLSELDIVVKGFFTAIMIIQDNLIKTCNR